MLRINFCSVEIKLSNHESISEMWKAYIGIGLYFILEKLWGVLNKNIILGLGQKSFLRKNFLNK